MSEYIPYPGFYDLRDYILPKRLFKKLWGIQDMLSHMRDRAEYYKKWHPGQWGMARELSADYQRRLFQHGKKTP